MAPDERSQIPLPQCCKDCLYNIQYLSARGDHMESRHECNHPFGVLPHPECGWFKQRAPSVGGEHA